MAKLRSIKQLNQKVEKRFKFEGIWKEVFGEPTKTGIWLVYGEEKHGKTTLSLMLADYLSNFERTLYVSAEEGIDADFRAAIKRAKVQEAGRKLLFSDFIPLEELEEVLSKKQAPKVVIVDNITVYVDELRYGKLRELHQNYKDKVLFVFIAHEENNTPYTSTAKLCKRLAKAIVRVEGLAAFVSGRVPGGSLLIDDKKAMLYHGSKISNTTPPK